jgi:hypothetical protein
VIGVVHSIGFDEYLSSVNGVEPKAEISKIKECASWHTVVGMMYSIVFDEYLYPVNGGKP